MLRSWLAIGLVALAFGGTAVPSSAQTTATICVTEWGWCHLPTLAAPLGVGCVCLTAQNQQVLGITRYMPYSGPASPYLQPHTGPPSTIR